jgi:thioredoxin-dependent peroxiredoxin
MPITKTTKSAAKSAPVPDAMLGQPVPDFTLALSSGNTVSNASLRGKPFVLYFYPKDDTPGCTTEACGFRDALPDFTALGVTVIGVSKDSLASHDKFIAKHNLNFPLATDPDGVALAAFGVWVEKSMYGKKYMGIDRATFVVDAAGIVRAVWRKVSVTNHVAAVAAAIKEIATQK